MRLQDLKLDVWDRVDDVPADTAVVRWFNAAQNRLAASVNAKFPSLIDANGTFNPLVEPVYDEKWQEALVVFACARFKEAESSINEANNFQSQFDELKKEFTENYEVPVQYRDDRNTQQFTASQGQTLFTITKEGFDPVYGDLKVHVNGVESTHFWIREKSFEFNAIQNPLVSGDIVTAIWEESYAYQEPPYPWQGAW